jgi:hypothetical protein
MAMGVFVLLISFFFSLLFPFLVLLYAKTWYPVPPAVSLLEGAYACEGLGQEEALGSLVGETTSSVTTKTDVNHSDLQKETVYRIAGLKTEMSRLV